MAGAVFARGDAVDVLEGTGEVQLVVVADLAGDLADGQAGLLEQLGGAGHPVVQQVGLGAFAHRPAEHLAEIAAVEAADLGDLRCKSRAGGTPPGGGGWPRTGPAGPERGSRGRSGGWGWRRRG